MTARRERALPPVRDWRTVPPVLTADEMEVVLACGRTHLDDLIDQGLPAVNIGHDLKAGKKGTGRTRRMLRFIWRDVEEWLREHRNGKRGGGQAGPDGT